MVEAELFIVDLRNQVRNLQSLLNYLESRDRIDSDDYTFSTERLRDIVCRVKELEAAAAKRGVANRLRADWLN